MSKRVRLSPDHMIPGRPIGRSTKSVLAALLFGLALSGAIALLPAPVARAASTGPAPGVVENLGQLSVPARYYARCGEATLFFTDSGVVCDFPQRGWAVRLTFAGVAGRGRPVAEGELSTRLNYFLGNDPLRWKSGVRVFSDVLYRDLWPGVDVRFRPSAGRLRYEVTDRTGAGPARFSFEGADTAGLPGGGLELSRPRGVGCSIRDLPDGATARVLEWGTGEGGSAPIPDPPRDMPGALSWSTFVGGEYNDYSHGVVLDSFGRVTVAGYTASPDFPTTIGAYDRTQGGSYDVFVTKLSPDGSSILWSTFIGGSQEDRPFALSLDRFNQPVVTGGTYSSNYPTTSAAYDRTLNGPRDVFVSKLSSSGSVLLWSTYLGGSSSECAWNLNLDPDAQPIVVGETLSSDYPTTAGAFDQTFGGERDAFVTKLDASGHSLLWSTFLGGSSTDIGNAVLFDSTRAPIIAGTTYSTDFPSTPGAFQEHSAGVEDCFLTKLDPDGRSLVSSTYFGGVLNDVVNGLAQAPNGDLVIAGTTESADFPVTPGAYDATYNGAGDIFVARLDPAASRLLWGTYVGGSDLDIAVPVALDSLECPVLTGETSSSDFPTTATAFDRSYNGSQDAFIARLNANGSGLLWSTYVGGSEWESGWDIMLDATGDPIVAGPTRSRNFPTTAGSYQPQYGGGDEDAFILRMVVPEAVGVPSPSAPPERAAVSVLPNPFRESMQIRVSLPQAGPVRLTLVDASGRRQAGWSAGWMAAGDHAICWPGRDGPTRLPGPGVYWVRLESGSAASAAKVVRVR